MIPQIEIDNEYAAVLLIEILFEKGLCKSANLYKRKKTAESAHFTSCLTLGRI